MSSSDSGESETTQQLLEKLRGKREEKLAKSTSNKSPPTSPQTRAQASAAAAKGKGPSGGTRGKGRALPTNKKRAAPAAAKKGPKKKTKEQIAAEKERKKVKQETAKAFNSKKPPNFDSEEDLLLSRAYVNTSENAVIGNNQKGKVFWAGVGSCFRDLYNELDEKVEGLARSNDACMNRFQRHIHPAVQQFNAYYKELKEQKPSGWKEEDLIKAAKEAFEEATGKEFKFDHCVEVLHKMPKYNPMIEDLVPDGEEEDNGGVNHIGSVMGDSIARPIGTKKAKKQQKDDNTRASMESTRQETLVSIAQATNRLADELAEKQAADSLYKMGQYFLQIGDLEQASVYMKQFQEACAIKKKKPPAVINVTHASSFTSGAADNPTPGVAAAAAAPASTNHSEDDALDGSLNITDKEVMGIIARPEENSNGDDEDDSEDEEIKKTAV